MTKFELSGGGGERRVSIYALPTAIELLPFGDISERPRPSPCTDARHSSCRTRRRGACHSWVRPGPAHAGSMVPALAGDGREALGAGMPRHQQDEGTK